MRTVLRTTIFLSLCIFVVKHLDAEMSVKEYRADVVNPITKDMVLSYISGLGAGMILANSMLRTDRDSGLFCAPERMALRMTNFVEMLDIKIKATETEIGAEATESAKIEYLLMGAMKDTFPCTKH
jgi:hypothetical protein